MRHAAALAALLGLASVPAVHAANDCSGNIVPQPLPVRPTGVPPLAMELPGGGSQLGAPSGVLARGFDEMMAVDRVLLRLRLEGCQNVAAAGAGAGAVADAGAGQATAATGAAAPAQEYQKRTQWDNKPYRFNAGGDGKKFSAEEFDAWMKSRGVRVAKGKPATTEAAPAPAEDAGK